LTIECNALFTKTIKQFKDSLHIGDILGRLHDSEMDFADHYVKIGGFLIGQSEVTIEWYLMKAHQRNVISDPSIKYPFFDWITTTPSSGRLSSIRKPSLQMCDDTDIKYINI
jgi:hypothetical protein